MTQCTDRLQAGSSRRVQHPSLDMDTMKPTLEPEAGRSPTLCLLADPAQVCSRSNAEIVLTDERRRPVEESGSQPRASTRHSPWMSPVCLASTLQHSGLTKATGDCSLPYSDRIWQPRVPHFCKHWGSKEISIAGTVCGCDYHGLQSNFCYCLPLQHNPNACGRGLIS